VLQRRDMSDRDLSPLFAPTSAAVAGAGERTTSSGGRLWRTRGARQSRARHDIRLRNGASIASIGHAFEAAMAHAASTYDMIMMIHVVPLWSMQRR
jgi:hypothetical protein